MQRLRTPQHIRALYALIVFCGVIGLSGYYFKLQSQSGWYSSSWFVRMSLPIMAVAMLLASGVWSISYQKRARAESSSVNSQELVGIFGVSALVLFLAVAAAGITAMVAMQREILHTDSEDLAQVSQDDRNLIEQVIHDRSELALVAADEASLRERVLALSIKPAHHHRTRLSIGDAGSPSLLREFGANLLAHGFSGSVLRGSNGEEFRVGKMIEDAPIRAPLHDAAEGELIWKNGYFLSTRITSRAKDGASSEMFAQQPLELLDRLIAESSSHKNSTLLLCTRVVDAATASCFPTGIESAPFRIPLSGHSRLTKSPLPIQLALEGNAGTGLMRDYRNTAVETSYLPVRNASLELVLEEDSADLYAPVQRTLVYGLPLLVLLTFAGLWILQWRLNALFGKLVASREEIRQLALHDVLTGLPNRSLMEDRLRMALLSARRNSSLVALAIVDIDNFKTVNDNFGHETGDLLLKAVANGLKNSIRGSDTAARLGGDEFVLIIPDIKFPEATILVAKKIQSIFSSPITAGAYTSSISLSIGVAVYPAAGEDGQALLRNADAAMYRAKKRGGDRFEIYGPTVK